ncbi:MAG: hypothetical protein ISS23_02765 [Nanoarchaeota archaeon]|nr:hypothetical protein [Nanoarchaeota archaeon]
MPFEPERAKGYAPTIEEIMEDIGIDSPKQFRETVLEKCRTLYKSAKKKKNVKKLGTSYEFVLCDSSDFYQTLVNLGHGNTSLIILDDFGPDVFFLLFKDKVPKKFYPIVAKHEATEYQEVQKGLEQSIAHSNATIAEIKKAEELGLKQDYLKFLEQNYPGKFEELEE